MSFREYLRVATLAPDEGDEIEYLSIRSRVACNALVNSQRDIPGTGCNYDPDVTALWQEYERLKKEVSYPLPFNTLMMKVLVECLKQAPRLNAHFDYNHTSSSGRLIIKKHIDVSMPVCFENGETFTVKIRELEDKSLEEIARQIELTKARLENTNFKKVLFNVAGQRMFGYAVKGRLITTFAQFIAAYTGKGKIAKFSKLFRKKSYRHEGYKKDGPGSLRVEDFTEGTVCFTNWGTLYEGLKADITYIPPLYPQVFMFGTGRVKEVKDVFRNEKGELDLRMKKVLPVMMVFDHKIGGAADLMPFIKKLDEILEHPEIIREW